MFFDWLSCYQDFDYQLPIISNDGYAFVDFVDGTISPLRQNRVQHEGSYSTSISVHVKGNRIVVSGNPSRFNRLDNLFGLKTIDQCFEVYNKILLSLDLPVFTKGTEFLFLEKKTATGSITLEPVSNGAIVTRLDITSNFALGSGNCVDTYIRALSMLPYLYRQPRIHADGKTVDWLSKQGNAREMYPSVYNKGYEIALHTLPKVKRAFGEDSPEFLYCANLVTYCNEQGVSRHEQKLNAPFLNKHNLQYYGLSNYSKLTQIHAQFINIDQKLKVSAMNILTITRTLLDEGICTNTKSANATSLYAINWMHGEVFDSSKRQVKEHRARLRKIGIDIAKPCNIALFSPVIVKEVIEITRRPLTAPNWYQHHEMNQLRVVA